MKKIIAKLGALLFAAAFFTGCAAAPKEEAAPALALYVKQKTVTTETEQLTLAIVNESDKHYIFDYSQQLEVKNGEAYEPVPLTNEAVSTVILHIAAGETQEISFDLANHYAPLARGSYRIVKSFTDDEGNVVTAVCEFGVL